MNLTEEQKAVVRRVRHAEHKDFATLVRIAGLDPKSDFRGANLAGVDFGSSVLFGFDFSGADLRGAIFKSALITGAVLTGANTDGVEWSDGQYGPFHRLSSPSQTNEIAQMQMQTGMIAGRAAFGSALRSIKAYRGRLPPQSSGVEFVTPFAPSITPRPPLQVTWYEGDTGVTIVVIGTEEFAAIPVTIIKHVDAADPSNASRIDLGSLQPAESEAPKESPLEQVLQQKLTLESITRYTELKFPNLPVSGEWTDRLIGDLDSSYYKTIRDIDRAVEYARIEVSAYAQRNPIAFRYGTDWITKSLIFTDKEFGRRHFVSKETLSAAKSAKIYIKRRKPP